MPYPWHRTISAQQLSLNCRELRLAPAARPQRAGRAPQEWSTPFQERQAETHPGRLRRWEAGSGEAGPELSLENFILGQAWAWPLAEGRWAESNPRQVRAARGWPVGVLEPFCCPPGSVRAWVFCEPTNRGTAAPLPCPLASRPNGGQAGALTGRLFSRRI